MKIEVGNYVRWHGYRWMVVGFHRTKSGRQQARLVMPYFTRNAHRRAFVDELELIETEQELEELREEK